MQLFQYFMIHLATTHSKGFVCRMIYIKRFFKKTKNCVIVNMISTRRRLFCNLGRSLQCQSVVTVICKTVPFSWYLPGL